MTADAARSLPGVRDVTVAELVPEVVRAAREDFAVANRGCLDYPRVRVLAIDAAHFLRGSTARYDVIVSEPSNPWVAGMSDLFTREALRRGARAAQPGRRAGRVVSRVQHERRRGGVHRHHLPVGVSARRAGGGDPRVGLPPRGVAGAVHPRHGRLPRPRGAPRRGRAGLQGAGIDGEGALLARVLSGTRGPGAGGRRR